MHKCFQVILLPANHLLIQLYPKARCIYSNKIHWNLSKEKDGWDKESFYRESEVSYLAQDYVQRKKHRDTCILSIMILEKASVRGRNIVSLRVTGKFKSMCVWFNDRKAIWDGRRCGPRNLWYVGESHRKIFLLQMPTAQWHTWKFDQNCWWERGLFLILNSNLII